MTLLFHDTLFLEHETGRHPERPARLRAVHDRLEASGLLARCAPGTYQPLTLDQVDALQVHDRAVLERARQVAAGGGGHLDPDTVLCPRSFEVALAAAGACVAAVDQVLAGADHTALCLVRPPGHHATRARSMGFCLVNNIAVAAEHARTRHNLHNVLVVDWDVHHGNGTQDVFYADHDITFLSIHRFGWGFYPGTGDSDETGRGPGLGHTFNVPVRHGTSRAEYLAMFRSALERAAGRSRPDLVLLSAGFDAHATDPIGSLGLEVEDFVTMTAAVLDVARTHARGRLVSCLEGGYNLDALAESVRAHLEGLLATD